MSNFHPNWPAPPQITAFTTLRNNGLSQYPFQTNNLALHVGDNKEAVIANRQSLKSFLALEAELEWLEQSHSNRCVVVEEETNRTADAAITREANRCLVVMTADCLPILLCNRQGKELAAIHAGWRGLSDGIIENTVKKMYSPLTDILAWIGPAICQACYTVGEDVVNHFQKSYPFAADAFKIHNHKLLANLTYLAGKILNSIGIFSLYQANICTYEQKNHFYSYRRESQTGRMATIICNKASR